MKRRLLFVSNLFPDSAARYRGLDNATVLHALSDRWDIRVISPRPSLSAWRNVPSTLSPRPIDEAFEPQFLPVPYVPKLGSRWNHSLMATRLRPAMQALRKTFAWDVVLGAWLYPDGCALVRCVAGECPVHLIAQGTDVHQYLNVGPRRAAILEAAKGATSIITRSASLAEALVRESVEPSKVHPVINGVDTLCFKHRNQHGTRGRLALDTSAKVVLFVGNLLPVKDPLLLLQAFAALVASEPAVAWRLVIIGDGPMRKQVIAKVAALGLDKRVQLLGPQPAEAVALWMSAADVLCLTSHNEGLPNVVLEAMASGLPVVATDVGGIREVINAPWKGSLCAMRSALDIAAALQQATHSPDRERIAEHGARDWVAASADYHSILDLDPS